MVAENYYEDNTYYDGGWENGLRHWEGIICNYDGNVIYCGKFYKGEKATYGNIGNIVIKSIIKLLEE